MASARMAAAKGDPVGVHDVRVARVGGQRLLPPASRSVVAPGLLRLLHVKPLSQPKFLPDVAEAAIANRR